MNSGVNGNMLYKMCLENCPISPIGRGIWLRTRVLQVRILCGAPQYIIDDDSERRELITYKVRLYLVSENNQVLLYLCRHGSTVEQLICNQQVGGSIPSGGSIFIDVSLKSYYNSALL